MGRRIPFPKSVDMSAVVEILENMRQQDHEGFLIDYLGRSVTGGSERDTKRFEELLEQAGIPFGWHAIEEEDRRLRELRFNCQEHLFLAIALGRENGVIESDDYTADAEALKITFTPTAKYRINRFIKVLTENDIPVIMPDQRGAA